MSRETTLAKIAAMAQLLDDHGLYDDATVMDELLEAAASADILKEAGLWGSILSRLGGWARKVLFREYREMYQSAKGAQQAIDKQIEELQDANAGLKKMLARHELVDWREGVGDLLSGLGKDEADLLSQYDEGRARMTARLLKLAPKPKGGEAGKAPAGKPVIPPLMPEEKPEEAAPGEGEGTPEKPFPLTKVKKPAPPAPGAPSEPPASGAASAPPGAPEPEPPTVPPEPEPGPAPAPAHTPAPGWRKEKFGRSGKHGWEWEWEMSPDGNRLRVPKNQLAAASVGKGMILHRQGDRYRPTGGTSSVKLRKLMGGTFWKAEEDPSDPNMMVLVRTDEAVPFPLSMRQEPAEQARRLKELGKSSRERTGRLMAIAVGEPVGDEMSDEERLDAAAEALLEGYESEETGEEA